MEGLLAMNDYVGISFFMTSMALLAATVFFVLERQNVDRKWQLSMTVMVLVTLVAFVHYLYMRELWIKVQTSPVVYRYIDWFITVPLQIIEFYLILNAVGLASRSLFWKLCIASVVMLVSGFIGEAGLGDPVYYFIVGTIAWLYIVYEVFLGQAAGQYCKINNRSVRMAFNGMRWIVTVGWAIYPVGYVYGIGGDQGGINTLNMIYNIADFLNKIAFGLLIWHAANCDSLRRRKNASHSRQGRAPAFSPGVDRDSQ